MSSDDGASGPVLNQPEADASLRAKDEVAAAIKKRKLYRQITGQEAQWFPHDRDPDLLKELCWEAGSPSTATAAAAGTCTATATTRHFSNPETQARG